MRLVLLMPLLLIATPALAVDFGKTFMGDDGKPVCTIEMKDGADCPVDKIFTLRMAARNALHFTYKDETLTDEEKFKRGELAQSLVGANELKLKAEDIVIIKKLIAKMYGPLIIFQAWNALDPK